MIYVVKSSIPIYFHLDVLIEIKYKIKQGA